MRSLRIRVLAPPVASTATPTGVVVITSTHRAPPCPETYGPFDKRNGRFRNLWKTAAIDPCRARLVDDVAVAEPEDSGALPDAADGRTAADRAGADAFARLALELHDVRGVEETVGAVVQFALTALECTAAGVALVGSGRRAEVLALTDPRVAALYRLQIEAGEGPLITAIKQERLIVIADVETETQWPAVWSAFMAAEGIRSLVHVPLMLGGRARAVLSLYSDMPDAFDADDLAVAHILARHASVAIARARQEASLAQAIDARKLVGQAMGILMERYDLDGDRAFEVLKRYSQQTNRKLRDVAQELIDTRRLPH